MCGRTACSLDQEIIQNLCRLKNKHGITQKPAWRTAPNNDKYRPGYNCAPGSDLPVIFSTSHIKNQPDIKNISEDWIIQPMRWGLIPSWHNMDEKNFSYTINNAKYESIMDKNIFKSPLRKGQRCVVIAEGYFEWQTKDGEKQPYYIFRPSNDNFTDEVKDVSENTVDINDDYSSKPLEESQKSLLMMAGIFDVCNFDGNKSMYSYTIITVEAHSSLSWMHHRMPALLTNEEEIISWLDSDGVALDEALLLLKPKPDVEYFAVSKIVGNSKNDSFDCIKPVSLSKPKLNKTMAAFLAKGKKEENDTCIEKKIVKSKEKKNLLTSWLKTSPEDETEPAAKKFKK